MFSSLIFTTIKMTLSYSTEVSNLIDYDMIMCNDMNIPVEKLCFDYCFYKEHINVIIKIVETFGILRALNLSRQFHIENTSSTLNVNVYYDSKKFTNISHEYTYRSQCFQIVCDYYRLHLTRCNK